MIFVIYNITIIYLSEGKTMNTANAPLLKDPIHNGASDPVVIYNEEKGTHYMFYTARRADVEEEGVMWVHGSDIGIAESTDGGNSWEYVGVCKGLEYESGRNSLSYVRKLCPRYSCRLEAPAIHTSLHI